MFSHKCSVCGTKKDLTKVIKYGKGGKPYAAWRCPKHTVLM